MNIEQFSLTKGINRGGTNRFIEIIGGKTEIFEKYNGSPLNRVLI